MFEDEYSFTGDIPGYLDCDNDCDYDYDAGGSSDQELEEIRVEIERQKRLEKCSKVVRVPSRAPSVIDATGYRPTAQGQSVLSLEEDGSKSPFLYTPPESPSSVRQDSPLLKGLMDLRAACLSAGEDELPKPRFGPESRKGSSFHIQPRHCGSCVGTPQEKHTLYPQTFKDAEFPEVDSPEGEEGRVAWLKAENERLSARLMKKRTQTHELKEHEKSLQGEVTRMKAIIAELRAQIETARTTEESQKREIENLKELCKTQAKKVEENEQEFSERELWYEENAESLQSQITELTEECKKKEAANKELQERLDKVEAEKSANEQKLRRRVTQLELRCLDLSSQVALQGSTDY